MATYIVDYDGTIVWEPTIEDFERLRIEQDELLDSVRDYRVDCDID